MTIPKLCLCAALSLLLVPPPPAVGQGTVTLLPTAGGDAASSTTPGAGTGTATSGPVTAAPAQVAASATGGVVGAATKAVVKNVIEQASSEGVKSVDLGEAIGSVDDPSFARDVAVSTTLSQATTLVAANAVQGMGPAGPLVKAALATTVSTVGTDLVDGNKKKDWGRIVFTSSVGILASTFLFSGLPLWASVGAGVVVSVAADEFYDWAAPRIVALLQPRRPTPARADAPVDRGERPEALTLLGVESPAALAR